MLNRLATKPNLELAWRRITTGGNQQYKRFFRDLYYAYEVAHEKNLRDLRSRLLGGSFRPSSPERIYVPKPSGLHRPLALLAVEDQIVLQAFANLAAKKLQAKRSPLQFRVVFSNILQEPNSIFFFRRWQQTYAAFQKQIRERYERNLRWVGDFDLAAFYDTISHELLLKTIYPRTRSADLDWIGDCLRKWSSDRIASNHGHGIPQGPIASDLLAECFLLPVDLALQKRRGYVRYVDDVRLFGESEDAVRAELIELERHCRERGLIPQTGKFAIRRATSLQEAMGMLPSISDPHDTSGAGSLGRSTARKAFKSALEGKPYRVRDKTRLRFILYRAKPDSQVLRWALLLIPRHPEHADAFFHYVSEFGYRKPIELTALRLIAESPYAYVRGEAWHVLARYRAVERSETSRGKARELTERAIRLARSKKTDLVEAWGACHFLCASEGATGARHSSWLNFQRPLVQALLAPALPDTAIRRGDIVKRYLSRSSPEPGLSICARLADADVSPEEVGLDVSALPSQVANTLEILGLISAPSTDVDPISEILHLRYRIPTDKSFHRLLGSEYVHALGLLKLAEAAFDTGPSFWLACQNGFNQTIFLALQGHFAATGHPGACATRNKSGQLVDFGVTLDPNQSFAGVCPDICACFREINARRNRVPVSHPYQKKDQSRTEHLSRQERNRFVASLRRAYVAFLQEMPEASGPTGATN